MAPERMKCRQNLSRSVAMSLDGLYADTGPCHELCKITLQFADKG